MGLHKFIAGLMTFQSLSFIATASRVGKSAQGVAGICCVCLDGIAKRNLDNDVTTRITPTQIAEAQTLSSTLYQRIVGGN